MPTTPPDSDTPPTRSFGPDSPFEAGDSLFELTGDDPDATQAHPIRPARPGEGPFLPEVPEYDLIEVIGRGGMGVVYKARQRGLNRVVALKMIIAGRHAEEDDRERFRREAEAVAKLAHPCIVQIYEISDLDGMPYFSMEFCTGGSLFEKLRGTPLAPKLAARLAQQVAWGVHAAHLQGIIHRDLKPGNILLQPVGGGPGPDPAELVVAKITDFGLAKSIAGQDALDGPRTKTGWILGTPSYMAPEQARCALDQLGPATDVYAVGAILYEMLTGRPPFKATNDLDTLRHLLSVEPIPPSRLEPKVPRDLETICLKCLEKDPRKRYPSAQALADDLSCYRKEQPIAARPVGLAERLWRWTKSKPTTAAVAAVAMLAVLVGLGIWASFTAQLSSAAESARRAETEAGKERDKANTAAIRAEEQLEIAEKGLYAYQLVLADRAIERNDTARSAELLHECRWDFRGWEWRHLMLRCEQKPAGASRFIEVPASPDAFAFLPDGKIVTGGRDGAVRVVDPQDGRVVRTLATHAGGVLDVAVSAAAGRVVTGGRDRKARVWELRTGVQLAELPCHDREVGGVAISTDGTAVAVFDRYHLSVWDVASPGAARFTPVRVRGYHHSSEHAAVAISPDGEAVAHADDQGQVIVRSAKTGEAVFIATGHAAHVTRVAFHPDSDRFVSASEDGTIMLWGRRRGGAIATVRSHQGVVPAVNFSPDGTRIISAGANGALFLHDADTGQELLACRDSDRAARRIELSPDLNTLVALEAAGRLRVLSAVPGRGLVSFRAGSVVACATFDATGTRIATGTHEGVVQVWDAACGKETFREADHTSTVVSVHFVDRDGEFLASAAGYPLRPEREGNYEVRLTQLPHGPRRLHFPAHRLSLNHMAISPDREFAATGSIDATVKVWELAGGSLVRELKAATPVVDVAFRPDGNVIAASGLDHSIRLWDWPSGKAKRTLTGHRLPVVAIAFSPDGSTLASASALVDPGGKKPSDGEVIVFDVESGSERFRLKGLRQPVWALDYASSGRVIATGGGRLNELATGGELKLWDGATGEMVHEYPEQNGVVFGLDFAPDGERFVAGGGDRMVRVFAVPPAFRGKGE